MIFDKWKCGGGNYIVAGSDCFVSLLGNFMDKHGGSDYFDDDKVNTLLHNSTNRFLYSYGTGLSYKTRKLSNKHGARISREVNKIVSRSLMRNTKLYIDSGGFQVAMGAVETKNMPLFIKQYHDFLNDNHKNFSHAFSLDLPPGPTSSSDIFESYQQIENLNRMSYNMSVELPKEIKDKMLYIHHFRTPSLYDTWSRFLWEENLAEGFNNFATGGLVANMATDTAIPVIIYVIPLSEILNYALANNKTKFNFHVLGGANFIDVFYHKLFSYHIQRVHGIEVNITYDSSAIFKALAIGRFIPVFKDDGTLVKMDLKSKSLHLRFEKDISIRDKVYQLTNEIAENYGFKKLSPESEPIYNKESGTLTRSVHMYLICYMLRIYRELELISQDVVESIYPLYEQGQQDEFDKICYDLGRDFNQGKRTRKQKAKIASIYRSLKILTDMDRDYNKYLINKFMYSDDVSSMAGGGSLKF